MRNSAFVIWGIAFASVAFAVGTDAACPAKPYIILNEDCNHYLGVFMNSAKRKAGGQIEKSDILHYVDSWLKPAVTHYFINPGGETAWYDSKVVERCWDVHEKRRCADCGQGPEMAVLKDMAARGLDPFSVMFERAREKGISPWLSMRMNDAHSINNTNICSSSTFWLEHPECRREPKLVPRVGVGYAHFCLDYAHKEVRDYHLTILQDCLDRWDADGVEFDWMRWHTHLAPGREKADAPFLTEFLRCARKLTEASAARRGHPVKIAVRVATAPESALELGTDAFAWARAGVVDLVIPCNFLESADFAMPLKAWRERLSKENPQVKVIPGFDQKIIMEYKPYHDWGVHRVMTDAEYAGLCERFLSEGAEGVYLFNHFDLWRDSPAGRLVTEPGALSLERLRTMPREYPISHRDGTLTAGGAACQLPLPLDKPAMLRLSLGKPLGAASCRVKLAFAEKPSKELVAGIRLNGEKPLKGEWLEIGPWLGPKPESKSALALAFAVSAVRDGDDNVLTLGGEAGAPTLRACVLCLSPAAEAR